MSSHFLPYKPRENQIETINNDNIQVIQPQNQHNQIIRRNNASTAPTAV